MGIELNCSSTTHSMLDISFDQVVTGEGDKREIELGAVLDAWKSRLLDNIIVLLFLSATFRAIISPFMYASTVTIRSGLPSLPLRRNLSSEAFWLVKPRMVKIRLLFLSTCQLILASDVKATHR